jgi:predicted regulator of Ras-like GTPase activity (Roadblock/LC7/MglB family)
MSLLDEVLLEVVGDVDGALGCAVVDLTNGLLLAAAHSVPYFTQSYLEAVAAAAVDMFRGKNVRTIETLLSQQRGRLVENAITEIQMSTSGTFHFMAIVQDKPHILLVLITSRDTNLGLGWFEVRKNLPKVGRLCP